MTRKRNERRKRTPEERARRPLVTLSVAARRLGFDSATVRGWVDNGELRGRVLRGRYYVYRDALDELVDGGS